MEANLLPPPSRSKCPPFPHKTQPFFSPTLPVHFRHHRVLRATGPATTNNSANSDINDSSNRNSGGNNNSNNDNTTKSNSEATAPPQRALKTLNIRRISRRQARKQEIEQQKVDKATPLPPRQPKDWDSMTLGEKAVELYMGEKGLLFWLNKFAYASIFIVIGGWIVFRFGGPWLGLYQLDTPPLSPSSIFEGSS